MMPSLKNLTSTFIGNHVTGQECTQNFLNRLENLPWVFSALVATRDFNAAAAAHENSSNIFKTLHKVKVLDLSAAQNFTEKELYLFIKALATAEASGAPALQELKLPRMYLSKESLQLLLAKLPKLVKLDLSEIEGSNKGVIQVFEALKQKPCKLVSLRLPEKISIKKTSQAYGSDKSLAVDTLFRACPQLKHLQISSYHRSDYQLIAQQQRLDSFGEMRCFFRKPEVLTKFRATFAGLKDGLSCLNLTGPAVNRMTSEEINDIIRSYPNLEVLHLDIYASGVSELNTAGIKDVKINSRFPLQKLHAPGAIRLYCTGMALREVCAPRAEAVYVSHNQSLEKLEIPAAKYVTCEECPKLKVISAPSALKLTCSYMLDREENGLEEVYAPNALHVEANDCVRLRKLVAPKARFVNCGRSALKSLWAPHATWVSVRWNKSIAKVYTPKAETLYVYGCEKLERIVAPDKAIVK